MSFANTFLGGAFMYIERMNEGASLQQRFEKPGSQLIVFYGQRGIGKTSILNTFTKDKESLYYLARPMSVESQLRAISREIPKLGLAGGNLRFSDIFAAMAEKQKSKFVVVIDEFQHLLKNESDFMEALIALLNHTYSKADVFVVLCSSSVAFVENSMISKLGKSASAISGFIKVREWQFDTIQEMFPNYNFTEQCKIYAIMGGIPGLLGKLDPKVSVKKNICNAILKEDSFLQSTIERQMSEELRELSVYNTILLSLASGNEKLNDLYLDTGFPRAKIVVYLCNLMEMELVEKVFSYEVPGKNETKKGVYRIKNHFAAFWFTFVFPHLSALTYMDAEEFYDTYIETTLFEYTSQYFGLICRQYMLDLYKNEELPIDVEDYGIWVGKKGSLHMIMQGEDKNIIAQGYFGKTVSVNDYDALLSLSKCAKIKPDFTYLFSTAGFDEALREKSESDTGIVLIEL